MSLNAPLRLALTALAMVTTHALMPWPGAGYHMVDPVFTPYYSNGTLNLAAIPHYAQLSATNEVDIVLLGVRLLDPVDD